MDKKTSNAGKVAGAVGLAAGAQGRDDRRLPHLELPQRRQPAEGAALPARVGRRAAKDPRGSRARGASRSLRAIEGRRAVVGGEAEARGVVGGQAAGAGVDLRVRSGRIDGEAAAGRGRVGVVGGVDGPDLEGVGAVGERGGGVGVAGARAVSEEIGVDPALDVGGGSDRKSVV